MSPIPVHEDTYYVIAEIASDGGALAKRWSNTFFFKDDGATPMSFPAAADAVKVLLDKFYGDAQPPGTVPLAGWLAAHVDIATSVYKVYNLNVPAPRTPEVRAFKSMTVNTGRAPNEVAGVISYRSGAGGSGGGTLDKTKRGRLFIGPLSSTCWEANTTLDDVQMITSFRDSLLGAADMLRDQATNDLTWVQYSRKTDTLGNVTGGFVDRSFDTVRKRGVRSQLRSVW